MKRLDALAEMLPEAHTLADIGTDHGRLLIALLRSGKIRRGIGVEIARGPWRRALANVEAQEMAARIDIRLGDGLAPILPEEAEACAIAGLGGKTITGILERRPDVSARLTWLLLQPMSGMKEVRLYLQREGWRIEKESLVEERGILYTLILAGRGEMPPLSAAEAEFGPLLLAERPPLLHALIRQNIEERMEIIRSLGKSSSEASHRKKIRLRAEIGQWEDLLP